VAFSASFIGRLRVSLRGLFSSVFRQSSNDYQSPERNARIAMSLETKDVANIAHLARLTITEEEMPVYASGLSKIINFVEQLNAADVADVEPMAHPLAGQVQRMRVDEITETDAHERYQANAPRVDSGLYLVPKVIE
jgi:aspartyl-tRNA(Asn)/glutamyl-tRNA(Gln) amidotransferase subunit C